jgi:hypothetical protein
VVVEACTIKGLQQHRKKKKDKKTELINEKKNTQ